MFSICERCRNLVHNVCLTKKYCISCIPISNDQLFTDLKCSRLDKLYLEYDCDTLFNDQPIFSPFEFYEKNIIDYLPDVDALSSNLQICSTILNSCNYYKTVNFDNFLNTSNMNALIGLNIDGVRSNFDQFKILHKDLNKSGNVVGYFICESNVTVDEAQTFYLEGYNKFVLNRISKEDNTLKHKGSGLIIFLHQCFNRVQTCPELSISTMDFECLSIEVVTNRQKILFIVAYRSPSGNFSNFIDMLSNLLEKANDRKDLKTYIFGDFNVNLYNPKNSRCSDYLTCLFSNGFLPIISRATHFMSTNPTCIDHILVSDVSDIETSGILRAKVGHHLPVFTTVNIDTDKNMNNYSKPRIRINEYLLLSFGTELRSIENGLDFDKPADVCFTDFIDKFKDSYEKWFINSISNKRTDFKNSSDHRKDWITIGLAKSCATRESLYAT